MVDSVPIIVSTVLLIILVPSVAYVFISTPTKQDFIDHEKKDDDNMREIRQSLAQLGNKIDGAMLSMINRGHRNDRLD